MKNLNMMTTTIMIWALALIFNLNTATATDRQMVYEMGESGQTVSFALGAKEVSEAGAENEKSAGPGKTNPTGAGITLVVYEMGEGGHKISFPATLLEMTVEGRHSQKPESEAAAKSAKSNCRVVVFEMAESGLLVEFPVVEEEIITGDEEDTIASRTQN